MERLYIQINQEFPVYNLKDKALEVLSKVYDPEIPLDIVSLGLVKDVIVENNNIKVIMTLTTPKCPLEEIIKNAVLSKLKENFPDYNINLIFDFSKPWTSENISSEGKEKLRALGWKL